ncbi:putative bifunctional diguanylate cyclase/phosphodiesterase [Scytonema sp. NUACC26]|uniref:putative bifunctional diguanylate cyclase/phosphodiesterase n=1 Tax=Scytonema sp. NUACC26 TaxID=3140176 RepID=UPI0034DBD8AE
MDIYKFPPDPKSSSLTTSLQSFSKNACVSAVLIGMTVILGWIFDVPVLKSVFPGLVAMKANTAIGLILAGSALKLWHRRASNQIIRRTAQACALIVLAIGFLTVIEYGFNQDFHIDQLLFKTPIDPLNDAAPGRMAVHTAMTFVLLGCALLLLFIRHPNWQASQVLALVVFLIAFLGLLGYFYGNAYFYRFGSITSMALHTAVAFILLSLSILFASPNQGIVAVVVSHHVGGAIAQRILPAAILVPPVACGLALSGYRAQIYTAELGISLLSILNVIFFAVLIWWNAHFLNQVDHQRRQAETALRRAKEELENKVEERTVKLRQALEQLEYQAFYDALTGLPNHVKFLKSLRQCINRSLARSDYSFAVLYLNLDHYQIVKYSLGHCQSDKLLLEAIRRLKTCLTPMDVLAQVGSDEFAILLADLQNFQDAVLSAKRIHEVMKSPFNLNPPVESSTTNIGIVYSSIGYDQPEDFVRAADIAMHYAKVQGRDGTVVFNQDMQQRAIARLQLENDLQLALKSQQLYLNYQPIISLETGLIVSLEALVRWRHPTKGMVSPTEFIPLAEETGIIVPIGQWILQEACQQLSLWQKQFSDCKGLSMSVNLSGIQITQPDLIKVIDELLLVVGLSGENFKIEITESMLVNNAQEAALVLEQLQKRKIQVCIDDFGTGYSSYSYLHSLPLNTLKIDRSFVSGMGVNGKKSDIVRSIVTLAHNLELNVIAEGVETVEQLTILRALGCEYAQGYLFSKPLDAEATIALIAAGTFKL